MRLSIWKNLGLLWDAATLEEQRDITRFLLKAAYVDVLEQRLVAIGPKPVFWMLLSEVCEELGVALV